MPIYCPRQNYLYALRRCEFPCRGLVLARTSFHLYTVLWASTRSCACFYTPRIEGGLFWKNIVCLRLNTFLQQHQICEDRFPIPESLVVPPFDAPSMLV